MKKTAYIVIALLSVLLCQDALSKQKVRYEPQQGACQYVPKTTHHQLRWLCRCNGDVQPYSSWSARCGLPK